MKLHVYLEKPDSNWFHRDARWRVSWWPKDHPATASIGFPSWQEAMDTALQIAGELK